MISRAQGITVKDLFISIFLDMPAIYAGESASYTCVGVGKNIAAFCESLAEECGGGNPIQDSLSFVVCLQIEDNFSLQTVDEFIFLRSKVILLYNSRMSGGNFLYERTLRSSPSLI